MAFADADKAAVGCQVSTASAKAAEKAGWGSSAGISRNAVRSPHSLLHVKPPILLCDGHSTRRSCGKTSMLRRETRRSLLSAGQEHCASLAFPITHLITRLSRPITPPFRWLDTGVGFQSEVLVGRDSRTIHVLLHATIGHSKLFQECTPMSTAPESVSRR